MFKKILAVMKPENSNIVTDPDLIVFSAVNAVNNPGYFYLSLGRYGIMFPLLSILNYLFPKNAPYCSSRIFKLVMMNLTKKGHLGHFESSHSVEGPALTTTTQNMLNIRGAVKCDEIPDIAKEFFKERSREDWPSRQVLNDIYSNGCYLVPKGLIGSDSCDNEWCISFAHAEKMLVQSMDSFAFGVLSFLKPFRHEVLRPAVGDCLTSYMLKTSLFWTLEDINYGAEFDQSVSAILRECLRRVLYFVTEGFFPNYFVRVMDITINRFSVQDRAAIKKCVEDALQRVDQVIQHIYSKLMSSPFMSENSQIAEQVLNEGVPIGDLTDFRNAIQDNFMTMLFSLHSGNLIGNIYSKQTTVEECLYKLQKFYNSNEQHLTKWNRKQLLGKIFRFRILRDFKVQNVQSKSNIDFELQLFQNSSVDKTVFLSNVIDLSSSFILTGKLREGLEYLESIAQFFETHNYRRLLSLDAHRNLCVTSPVAMCEPFFKSHTDQGRLDWMVIDNVIITVAESAFSSYAILVKVMCLLHLSRDENIIFEAGSNVLHIDPLIYTHFLLFLCYRKMHKHIKQLRAIEYLKKTCHHPDIDCPDIAWNLLGYCYMEMNKERRALTAFYRALRKRKGVHVMIRRRPTYATPLFVAILINKHFRNEWSNIYE